MRDELKMVIKSYQTLYINCLGYGMRKYLLIDEEKSLLQERIDELEKECQNIEENVRKGEEEIISIQMQYEDSRNREEKEHTEYVQSEKEKLNQMQNNVFHIMQLKITPKDKDKK